MALAIQRESNQYIAAVELRTASEIILSPIFVRSLGYDRYDTGPGSGRGVSFVRIECHTVVPVLI